MPEVGDIQNITFKVSLDDMGFVAGGTVGFSTLLERWLKNNLEKKVTAKVGALLTGFTGFISIAAAITGIVAAVVYITGNEGVSITVQTKYRKITKHQGGKVIEVYGYALSGYGAAMY